MPFFLYRIEENEYIELASIELAGAFRDAALANANGAEGELSEEALLNSCGVDPERHGVIIDLEHLRGYRSPLWGMASALPPGFRAALRPITAKPRRSAAAAQKGCPTRTVHAICENALTPRAASVQSLSA